MASEETKKIELVRRPLLETKWCQSLIGMMLDYRLKSEELEAELAAAKAGKCPECGDRPKMSKAGVEYPCMYCGNPTPPPAEIEIGVGESCYKNKVYKNPPPAEALSPRQVKKRASKLRKDGEVDRANELEGEIERLAARVKELEGERANYARIASKGIEKDRMRDEATIAELREQLESEQGSHAITRRHLKQLKRERDEARTELANQTYEGNSIGYIYDKMTCYRTQVGTMGEMLRIIGVPYGECGDDNNVRSVEGPKAAYTYIASAQADTARLRKALLKAAGFLRDSGCITDADYAVEEAEKGTALDPHAASGEGGVFVDPASGKDRGARITAMHSPDGGIEIIDIEYSEATPPSDEAEKGGE